MCAPAECAALRRAQRTSRRGLRDPAATHRVVVAARLRRLAVPAPGSPAPAASTRTHPPSPTCTRTCVGEGSYVGKGIYDVDAFEAALAGRVPENTLAEPRPVRGNLRTRGTRFGHRTRGRVSRAYAVPRLAHIAGHAATGSCCPGSSAAVRPASPAPPLDSAARPVEDVRQPAADPVAPAAADPRGRVDPAAAVAALWTAFVVAMLALPSLPPVAGRPRSASRRIPSAAISARSGGCPAAAAAQRCAGVARAPGMVDVRCDRPDTVPAVRQPPQPARWVTAQEQSSRRLDVAGHYRQMAGGWSSAPAVLGLAATGQVSVLLAVPFALLWLSSPLLACW